jgi:transmembrane 9 superfamily protein 2/4
MIILILTGIVAMIMMRILNKEIDQYNADEQDTEIIEESGWKLLYGDVFRAPSSSTFFSIIIGTGIQILGNNYKIINVKRNYYNNNFFFNFWFFKSCK